jgi:hypothetical protein
MQECGVFIPKRGFGSVDALVSAVQYFCREEGRFDGNAARRRATDFSYSKFYSAWAAFAQAVGVCPGRSVELAASPTVFQAQSEQGIHKAC